MSINARTRIITANLNMVQYICDLQGRLWRSSPFNQKLISDHPPLQRRGRIYTEHRLFITEDRRLYDTVSNRVLNVNLSIVKLLWIETDRYILLDDYNCLYEFNMVNMTTKLIVKDVEFLMKHSDAYLLIINGKWNTLSLPNIITPISLDIPIDEDITNRQNVITVRGEYYLISNNMEVTKLHPPFNTINIVSYIVSFLYPDKNIKYEVAALTDDGKLYIRYKEEFELVNIDEIELYHYMSRWTSLIGNSYGVLLVNEDGNVYSIYYGYHDGDNIIGDTIDINLQYERGMFEVDDCRSNVRSSRSCLSD